MRSLVILLIIAMFFVLSFVSSDLLKIEMPFTNVNSFKHKSVTIPNNTFKPNSRSLIGVGYEDQQSQDTSSSCVCPIQDNESPCETNVKKSGGKIKKMKIKAKSRKSVSYSSDSDEADIIL